MASVGSKGASLLWMCVRVCVHVCLHWPASLLTKFLQLNLVRWNIQRELQGSTA